MPNFSLPSARVCVWPVTCLGGHGFFIAYRDMRLSLHLPRYWTGVSPIGRGEYLTRPLWRVRIFV